MPIKHWPKPIKPKKTKSKKNSPSKQRRTLKLFSPIEKRIMRPLNQYNTG